MSTAKERVTTRALLKGWKKDLEVLEAVFGPYGEDAFTPGAEMQRNLGTCITSAELLLAAKTGGAA